MPTKFDKYFENETSSTNESTKTSPAISYPKKVGSEKIRIFVTSSRMIYSLCFYYRYSSSSSFEIINTYTFTFDAELSKYI